LRRLGYTVTERVGKYPDGSQAFGVVAVLQNGVGPRLLLRTEPMPRARKWASCTPAGMTCT
jgi:hypothetical protein